MGWKQENGSEGSYDDITAFVVQLDSCINSKSYSNFCQKEAVKTRAAFENKTNIVSKEDCRTSQMDVLPSVQEEHVEMSDSEVDV